MSTLVCLVRAVLPVSVVTMAGTLDQRSMIKAGIVLRDCLAAQPVALVIEARGLSIIGARAAEWLRSVGADAGEWPGVPVMICDGPEALAADGTLRFASLGAALSAAHELPVAPREQVGLPPVPESCAVGRRFVAETCHSWGLDRISRLASLLASELITNAVLHARTPLMLVVRDAAAGLEVSVSDGDPRQVRRGDEHSRGAGLELIDALADAWGCAPTASGKVVWARISRTAAARDLVREPVRRSVAR